MLNKPGAGLGSATSASTARVSGLTRTFVFWSVLLAASLWFLTLGLRHLVPSDEGRYAEIAREMLVSGDWVTIRYNDLKYFEKPPLHLWMTALAYKLFGVHEFSARLWIAISGAFGLLMTALAARRWYGARVGWITAGVLLAAPAWNVGAHFNALDMSVSGLLAGVLAGVLLAQHPDASAQQRRLWMGFAWAAMGLAVLTKGLIGIVLPGLVLVLYTLISRDWVLWRRLHLISGALLMLAIVVPWFVLVSQRNPEFPHFFFIHEHWKRYTSTVHHRSAPWWYFAPQLLIGLLPWLGALPGAFKALRQERAGAGFRPRLLMAVWAGAIFVFFSLSSSKLPGYILPIFPALAVLMALWLSTLDAPAWRRQLLYALIAGALALLVWLPLEWFAVVRSRSPQLGQYLPWVGAAFGVMVAGTWLARRMAAGGIDRSLTTYSLAMCAGLTIATVGHESFGRVSAGVDLLPRMRTALTPQMPLYGVRLLDHTLPFYLRHTLIMVEQPDELAFGTQQEPDKWLPTMEAFNRAWTSGTPAMAVMAPETHAELLTQGLPMSVIAQNAKRVVVVNVPGAAP